MFDLAFTWEILPALGLAAVNTLTIAVASFGLALVLGLPLLLMRRSRWRWLAKATTAFVDFVRCTPLLIQLFFLYFALPSFGLALSPMTTGLLVFSVHFGCYMSEVYRAGLESVAPGQWEACSALGLSRWKTLYLVVLPLALRPIVPAAGVYLIHLFKETPLLSAISVQEMMFVASEIGSDRFRYLEPITLCGLLFLAMSLAASVLIGHVERRYALR
jgi:polar amino acid transport system permease protein